MRTCVAAGLLAAALAPAGELSPIALRIVGQVKPFANGLNLVEGRELSSPQGIVLDLSSTPAHLYVADTLNNRVLGWQDADGFSNGAMADLVIGQADFFGTGANAPGLPLGLSQPAGLAVDRTGNLYVADSGNHRVVRYRQPFAARIQAPDLVVGQPNLGTRERNGGLGTPSPFSLSAPLAVAVSTRGVVAVADTGNRRVLLFSGGSLVANNPPAVGVLGQTGFSETGNIATPAGLSFDAESRLYVADAIANQILQFPAGIGAGAAPLRVVGGNGDSARRGANTLFRPSGVAVSGDDLFIADTGNHRLLRLGGFTRSLEPKPTASAVFGQPDFASGSPNGNSRLAPLASEQSLSSPAQIAVGPRQELFVADAGNHRVVAIPEADGRYVRAARVLGQDNFAQTAANLVEGREVSTANTLNAPGGVMAAAGGVVVDSAASPPHVYIADTINHRVLAWRDLRSLREGMRADLVIGQPDLSTAIANYGTLAIENRPASATNLNHPSGLALDSGGNLYVADTGNHRVLRFPRPFELPSRADLVIGQQSLEGYPLTGTTAYLLNQPTGIAIHPELGDLAVADTLNNRVLYFPAPLTSGMAASRVFGQVAFSESARGLSSSAMTLPSGVALDSGDNLYIADTGNSRVLVFGPLRELPAVGAAALASGSAPIGQPDFVMGLGGTANNRLRNPASVWVNPTNTDIWVADTGNHRILRFPPLNVLAVNGGAAYASGGLFGQVNFTSRTPNLGATGGGQTSPVGLSFPNAVTLDGSGNLLVGDGNSRVLLYFPQAVAVSAATFLSGAPLAPGMIASVFGTELSEDTASAGLPLPLTLADTQVLVNDAPAPLLYASPGQINLQVPSDLEPGTVVRVEVVRASSGKAAAGGSFAVARAAAGIFGVVNEDGSLNAPSNPALRGAVVQIFATGQGALTRPIPDGVPAPSPPAETPSRPVVTIGTSSERDVVPEFSGLTPGFVGLWQINARVPASTAPSPRTPVVVRYAGSASNVVYIVVR